MKVMTMLTGLFAVVAANVGLCGELALTPEKVLAVHDGRDAYVPCAAFVRDNFVVVWQSGRLAPGDLRDGLNFNGDIVGCRVGKDPSAGSLLREDATAGTAGPGGNVLDAQPFVICGAGDLQERPRAAANGTVALVVWQDLRNGKDWDVYAARVSADGKVLDPDGFQVAGGAHNQVNPRVAWDGKTFVVVWQDYRSNTRYEVFAARITPDGRMPDAEGMAVSTQSGPTISCFDPAIASAGDGRSFVFWTCASSVFGPRCPFSEGTFLVDGKPAPTVYQNTINGDDPRAKQTPGCGGNTPSFVAAGPSTGSGLGKGSYLLAWRNEHPVGRGNGAVNANALVLDGQGKPGPDLSLAGYPHRILNADMVWDGSAFVAAWTELRTKDDRAYPAYEHVFASRLALDGKLTNPHQLVAGCTSPPAGWSYPGGQRAGGASFKPEPPAMNACVATDGSGATLIAYEKHPEKPENPIAIAFRMLTVK